jgi:hypothetical protein
MEDTKELDAIFKLGEKSGVKEKEIKGNNKGEGKDPEGESKDTRVESKATVEKAAKENEKPEGGEKK